MRARILLLLVVIIFLASPFKGTAQVNVQDSLALVDLYNNTNGPGWTKHDNWLTKAPLNTWYGLQLDGLQILSIKLGGNNLTGKLPIWQDIPGLDELDLSHNNLTDTIPASLTKLFWVAHIKLNNNHLSGHIPEGFTNARLAELDLSYNELSGSIPQIGGFSVNKILLNNNHLSGAVPQGILDLFNIGSLGFLYLQHNYLTFTGVEAVAAKTIGTRVYAPQDTILPISLSYDVYNTLSVNAGGQIAKNTFTWYKNGVAILTKTGDSTYYLKTNEVMQTTYSVTVTNNLVPGLTLFSDTFKITPYAVLRDSLVLVDLYNSTNGSKWRTDRSKNWLASPVYLWPGVKLDYAGRVAYIELENDSLSGTLPESIGNLTGIRGIRLNNNQITGSIPSSIGNAKTVDYLALQFNQLTGEIPRSMGQLTRLTFLSMANNNISGEIPAELGNLYLLLKLELPNNQLSGQLPLSLNKLQNLQELDLGNNNLSGAIPTPYTTWFNTYIPLNFNDNYFTFEGMEQIAKRYQPGMLFSQKTILTLHHIGNKISVFAGGTLANNTYKWYDDSTLITTIKGDSTFTPTHAGHYNVKVTNSVVIYLTLKSDTLIANSDLTKSIAPATPSTLTASYEYTAPDGWTHYYYDNKTPNNLTDDTLLLSLKKNGQNIGSIDDGTFAVKLVATPGAGSNTGILLNSPLITNPTGFYVMNRYWQVTATQQPAASVGVRFYYNNQDLKDVNGSYPTHNLTNDKLIFYKAVGGNPDPTSNLAGATKLISIMPGTQPTDTSWVYHQLSDTTQYGEYSVASFSGGGGGGTGNNKALPVTLLNFTGNRSKTDVQLNWQTAQEINTGNYAIERSLNGADFTGIGNVQAAGNSSIKQSYSYIDANAAAVNTQKLYYRLKIVDKDGSFNYSKIISLQNDGINTAYVLYPNPARTSATVQFTASAAAKYTVTITSAEGKVIKRVNITAATGVNRAVLNVGSLAHGTYIVTITGDEDRQTLTLVKE